MSGKNCLKFTLFNLYEKSCKFAAPNSEIFFSKNLIKIIQFHYRMSFQYGSLVRKIKWIEGKKKSKNGKMRNKKKWKKERKARIYNTKAQRMHSSMQTVAICLFYSFPLIFCHFFSLFSHLSRASCPILFEEPLRVGC